MISMRKACGGDYILPSALHANHTAIKSSGDFHPAARLVLSSLFHLALATKHHVFHLHALRK